MKYLFITLIAFMLISCKEVVVDYPHTADAEESTTYRVTINGTQLFTEQYKDFHYVHAALDKAAEIVVHYKETIDTFTISPLSKQIDGRKEEQQLSFSVPGAGYYVITINNDRKLFILVDKPENEIPAEKNIINIGEFVSFTNNGKTLLTEQLQVALDLAAGSGKTLYFPEGTYYTGMLTIHSNTSIYLAPGAMIKGVENRTYYPSDDNRPESDHINDKENFTDYGEWMTFSRLIFIKDAENVRIFGRGIIDGSGNIIRAQGKPANLIRILNSKNVEIDGVILRDPAAWNTHILYSEDVTIRNVKVLNDFDVPNTDGFDPDASRNVLIENCFAYCNDDNIAIKTTNNGDHLQNLENIYIRSCTFITKKSALKVGTETKAELMENILFEDNDVIECDRGMVLYCHDGATFKNVRFINNRFEKAFEKGQQRGIHFVIQNRYGSGKIEDILIKDCIFYTPFPRESRIYGLNEDHTIDHIKVENLIIGDKKVTSLTEADIEVNEFVNNIIFE